MLYSANFRHRTVDVYNQNFNLVNSFTDPTVPPAFAPQVAHVMAKHGRTRYELLHWEEARRVPPRHS